MAASTVTEVNDRVQTVLTAAGITDAVNNHAGLLDESQIVSFTVADGDFATGTGAKTVTVVTPSATRAAFIEDVWYTLGEVFAGGALSEVTLQVGQNNGPDTDAYVVATSVFTGASLTTVGFATAECGVARVAATRNPLLPATKAVTATFTPTGAAMSVATSGSVTIYVKYRLV